MRNRVWRKRRNERFRVSSFEFWVSRRSFTAKPPRRQDAETRRRGDAETREAGTRDRRPETRRTRRARAETQSNIDSLNKPCCKANLDAFALTSVSLVLVSPRLRVSASPRLRISHLRLSRVPCLRSRVPVSSASPCPRVPGLRAPCPRVSASCYFTNVPTGRQV